MRVTYEGTKNHNTHTTMYDISVTNVNLLNEVETLNVHFGRKHTKNPQCCLCDKIFESPRHLANHQIKCEIFMCANSGCRDYFENLNKLKTI